MKKVNRKIISIFLLLIIIASQRGPAVIATENNATETQTLEQYLVEHGVDEDGDKKISDAEWAKVKNLDLYEWSKKISDFTGLEKAVNLQYLELEDHDFNNVNFTNFSKLKVLRMHNCNANIDCSKFANLEKLSLGKGISINNTENLTSLKYLAINTSVCSQIDFTKLTQLRELDITGAGSSEDKIIKLPAMEKLEKLTCTFIEGGLDISELKDLNYLFIWDCENIKFPKFNKLSYIAMEDTFNINGNLDLQNCGAISGYIFESDIDKEKIKLNPNVMLTEGNVYNYVYAKSFTLEKLEDEINIELNKEYELGKNKETYKLVKNDNDNVATFYSYASGNINYAKIKAKNVGTTNMTVKDILGREKIIKVNVYAPKTNNVDTKLENTGITAKFIDYNTILKSNGELWKTDLFSTAEKVDENVKDYKTMFSWLNYDHLDRDEYIDVNDGENEGGDNSINIDGSIYLELTLKNNNLLNIKYNPYHNYEDNTYKTKKIPNVQAIGNTSYLTTDGKVYKININYITEELKTELIKENVKKLLDDCIVLNDGTTWYIDKCNGKYECQKLADFEIISTGIFSHNIKTVVDKENNLWCCKDTDGFDSDGLKLLRKKSEWKKKEEYKESYYIKILENGDAVLKENNKKIIDNVSEISSDYDGKDTILVRTDGTIWTYNIEDGLLTKITESASGDDKEEDKDFLNPTTKIHEKELGNTSILYGISDSTKVEDFKKQNNFNSTYEVKIYDKNDKELQDNNIIGTGSKVKLYKQGKIVKEYTVILYGDTTGDGKITSVDALAIIKHINNKIPFTKEEYIEAGKVRKESGKNLTSVDALATVKSVNGKFKIEKNN